MSSELENEIARRLDAWNQLQQSPNWPILTPREIRELGLYGGASGVWVDKTRTSSILPDGIAVGLLHTGKHYDDDVDETGILYHYPTTERPPSRDANEIQSIKNAKLLGVPVFVIENYQHGKRVHLAWVDDFDDPLRICVLTFHGSLPEANAYLLRNNPKENANKPVLFGERRTTKVQVEKAERDPLFKFNILKRFNGKCLVTSVDVPEMLDAAHIIPVRSGGTEDSANGLLLTASVHRAFDAGLWAINPDTLKIETKPEGPSPLKMRLEKIDFRDHSSVLNHDALGFRYEKLFLAGKKY
jgi:putative restriction endonuclease